MTGARRFKIISAWSLAVFYIAFSTVSAQRDVETASVDLSRILGLMSNLGSIKEIKKVEAVTSGEIVFNVLADQGKVQIVVGLDGSKLVSISRQASKPVKNRLKWEKDHAVEVARRYISALLNYSPVGKADLVTQENIGGFRNLWSVSWVRRIHGYKVREDFVTVNFTEDEGVFTLAHSSSVAEDFSLPDKLVGELEARSAANLAAPKVLAKFKDRFSAYTLGEVVATDCAIVAPNYALSRQVKTELDLLNGDTKNPRLAWMITFGVELDRSSESTQIVATGGLTIWIDAETATCIGADF